MSEESRLGREQIETAYALKQVITAGVRVFYYLEDRERTLDSPTDKILLAVSGFADEVEREKARQRTYDAMRRKAEAGHVTGGVVFGYDNVRVNGHVERQIHATEAAVVRRISEQYARGDNARRIALALNPEGAAAPTPRRTGRPRAWSASTVAAILTRPLYKARSSGTGARSATPGGYDSRAVAPPPSGCAARSRRCAPFPSCSGRPSRGREPRPARPTCARPTGSSGAGRRAASRASTS
jgi:recombinase/resolvase-like protein